MSGSSWERWQIAVLATSNDPMMVVRQNPSINLLSRRNFSAFWLLSERIFAHGKGVSQTSHTVSPHAWKAKRDTT